MDLFTEKPMATTCRVLDALAGVMLGIACALLLLSCATVARDIIEAASK